MTIKTPPEHPDEPGMRGTYGQGDFVQSAQRSRLRKDQHYAPRGPDVGGPDPYGEGGFAGGGDGQSGYGTDFGQLEGAQRHEHPVSESDYRQAERKSGTGSDQDR
jgi:hypothetical protein